MSVAALIAPHVPEQRKPEWAAVVGWLLYGKSRGLGDTVSKALSAVGVTKQRVSKITGKGCNCGKRQAALNHALPYRAKNRTENVANLQPHLPAQNAAGDNASTPSNGVTNG